MRARTASLFALSAASASLAAVVPRWQHALSCSDLWDAAPKMLANLEVYVAEDVPGESSFHALMSVAFVAPSLFAKRATAVALLHLADAVRYP